MVMWIFWKGPNSLGVSMESRHPGIQSCMYGGFLKTHTRFVESMYHAITNLNDDDDDVCVCV